MINPKQTTLALAALLLTLSQPMLALEGQSITNSDNEIVQENTVLRGSVISIPAGASVPGNSDRGMSSATARVGDRGFLTLNQDFYGIPAGSRVEYIVDRVKAASRGFDNPGSITLKAIEVTYPNGSKAPLLEAFVVSSGNGGTSMAGSSRGRRVATAAGKTAGGAAIGALSGLALSAIGGGVSGKAVAIGAGIGAGAGLIGAGVSKGQDVSISSGQKLFLRFNKASQVNVSN